MKTMIAVLMFLSSVTVFAGECTIHFNNGIMNEQSEEFQVRVEKLLEKKGYRLMDAKEPAMYELNVHSMIYCYDKKGPSTRAYERGYSILLSKGKLDLGTRENIFYEKQISSMVLFNIDFATQHLKRAIRHLPSCRGEVIEIE